MVMSNQPGYSSGLCYTLRMTVETYPNGLGTMFHPNGGLVIPPGESVVAIGQNAGALEAMLDNELAAVVAKNRPGREVVVLIDPFHRFSWAYAARTVITCVRDLASVSKTLDTVSAVAAARNRNRITGQHSPHILIVVGGLFEILAHLGQGRAERAIRQINDIAACDRSACTFIAGGWPGSSGRFVAELLPRTWVAAQGGFEMLAHDTPMVRKAAEQGQLGALVFSGTPARLRVGKLTDRDDMLQKAAIKLAVAPVRDESTSASALERLTPKTHTFKTGYAPYAIYGAVSNLVRRPDWKAAASLGSRARLTVAMLSELGIVATRINRHHVSEAIDSLIEEFGGLDHVA